MLDLEPEDTEEDMSGDLGVAALDEEVSQLLQKIQEETPLPTPASATSCLESAYMVIYSAEGRRSA